MGDPEPAAYLCPSVPLPLIGLQKGQMTGPIRSAPCLPGGKGSVSVSSSWEEVWRLRSLVFRAAQQEAQRPESSAGLAVLGPTGPCPCLP